MAIAGLLMVLGVSLASAERVRTTQTTKVMKRPGEKSAVVTRVQKGRTLTVIATEGRWFKVRVNGRTGWVARSTVQTASARDVPRNTRRRPFVDGRSTRRGGWGEAPEDRVGGDAVEEDEEEDEQDEEEARPRKTAKKAKVRPRRDVEEEEEDFEDEDEESFDEEDEEMEEEAEAPPPPKERIVQVAVAKTKLRSKPSKKGRATLRVKKGAKLIVVEEKNDWMLVEDPDGESGWIKKSEIWEPGMRAKRQIRVEGRLGFDRLAQVFRSDGDAQLSNYDVGAAAATVSLRADYMQKYGPKYLIGGEVRYDLGKSTPGIRYSDGTNAADIPFTTHHVDLRAVAGYDFHHKTGAAAFGRLGYHYSMFQVANVADFTKNLARLPSETLSGPTIGVAAELPRITEKLGGRVAADYLIAGKRAQTTGLEDGQVSAATALWGALVVDYQWKKDMVIDFAYGYDYAKTVWTGAAPASMRGTNSTEAARKDVTHSLTIGLAKTF
jgi:uncharacterized protein YgiM (DUF1202 family)